MICTSNPYVLSMIRYIGLPLASMFIFYIAVAVAYVYLRWHWIALPLIPLSIFGGAIGVIIGFRNNSSYQRWWEARTLWGSILNGSRTLSRQATTMITPCAGDDAGEETIFAMRRQIVYLQIAYVHALRCHLREQEPWHDLGTL